MLTAIWAKAQGWIIAVGAAIAVLVGVFLAGGRSAKQAREKKDLENKVKTIEDVNEISNKVHKMGTDDLSAEFDRLRNLRR